VAFPAKLGGLQGKEVSMLRTLGIVVVGMFAGAVTMEIVHKKYPDRLDKFYSKMGDVASEIKDGFKEGYRSSRQTQEPVQA